MINCREEDDISTLSALANGWPQISCKVPDSHFYRWTEKKYKTENYIDGAAMEGGGKSLL